MIVERPRLVPYGVAMLAAAALTPVVWLATSRFYWTNYDQPNPGYFFYNLARLWLMVVLLAVFWATGSRLAGSKSSSGHWLDRHAEFALCGAAAWSIGVAGLAAMHLYYLWLILPLVAIGTVLASSDLLRNWQDGQLLPSPVPRRRRLNILFMLGAGLVLLQAIAILLGGAIWGASGGDNDLGNYFPYYDSVLRAHTTVHIPYYVHFSASKGNGLAFLANILSDAQGASLVSYVVMLLGAALMWGMARPSLTTSAIGLLGVGLYLHFFAGETAFYKSHIIRNTFMLSLIVSTATSLLFGEERAVYNTRVRLLVIAAIIVLSPPASVLLVPMFLLETLFTAVLRGGTAARSGLVALLWVATVTGAMLLYNYLSAGLTELVSLPGHYMDRERFAEWVDPRLIYIHLASYDSFAAIDNLGHVMAGLLHPSLWYALAGCLSLAILGWGRQSWLRSGKWRASSGRLVRTTSSRLWGPGLATMYLVGVLGLVIAYRVLGGTAIARFTSFASPTGIALGLTMIVGVWHSIERPREQLFFKVFTLGIGAASIWATPGSLTGLPWRESVDFVVGRTSYGALQNQDDWDTLRARRIARLIPDAERADLLTFLPGFTAIPDTPFQRPDGTVYATQYSQVLYGSPADVAAVYKHWRVNYFVVNLSDQSAVMWNGFSPLFAPESMKTLLRVVTRDESVYLLTWRDKEAGADTPEFDEFLQKWSAKLTAEVNGFFHQSYERGRLWR